MSQIKRARSNVPNLAVGDNNDVFVSAFLGVLQSINPGGLKEKLNGFGSAIGSVFTFLNKAARDENLWIAIRQKSIQTERDWVSKANNVRDELIKNRKNPQDLTLPDGSNVTVKSSKQFDKDIGPLVRKMESDIADFSNRRQAQTQRIQKAGLTASIGGGLLGGAISQSIQDVSPDGSAAVHDLTS